MKNRKELKNKKQSKKYKLSYKKILIFILVIYLVFSGFLKIINKKITNIYIINNTYLSDKFIIDLAGIGDYPSIFLTSNKNIKKVLESNISIKSAKVYKKRFTEIYIEIEENRPLFYKQSSNKTVLLDGKEIDNNKNVPILINYIPDTIYDKFIQKMAKINKDIINRISEIEYNPNNVDDERFLLTMNDDNYVYLTLYKFESINNYIDIVKKFENKKGILYLDSGEYFKVVE